MRVLLFIGLLFSPIVCLFGQTDAPLFWAAPAHQELVLQRGALPSDYESFDASFAALQKTLLEAPEERAHRALEIHLPVLGKHLAPFALWQTDIMHPELGQRYPEIRTFSGKALDGSGTIVRVTISPQGLQAMFLRQDAGVVLLEPWVQGNTGSYILYDRNHLERELFTVHSACGVSENADAYWPGDATPTAAATRNAAELVKFRTYRFAVATTGHFAIDHGGTIPSVLAVVVDRTNRISAYFERDASIRLQLIPNNDKLIFLDPNTDPYTGDEVGSWMGQNTAVLNVVVGAQNYDIGHVFGRYFSGFAIGVASGANACTGNKGAGASAGFGGYGQSFVETAAHEVGHQLSASHTWNQCSPGAAAQRAGVTAYEPGSGSTIMSYSGSCGSNNIGASDDYFHAGSIAQIRNYTTNAAGATCGLLAEINNHLPEVTSLVPINLTIPMRTPFELKGSAVDLDGDPLSFAWEQMDAGEEVPLGTEGDGSAIFRSRPPSAQPARVLPRLPVVINNGNEATELLSSRTRELNFRLIARDNNPIGGGVAWQNVKMNVTDKAGPFIVLQPNAASAVWTQGAYELVRWDVANTDKPPVNCSSVDILLSTDNGQTYPTTLAVGVPNTGSAYILVPSSINTSTARIRINGSNSVFFDISNAGFRIQPPQQSGASLGVGTTAKQLCLPDNLLVDIFSSAVGGYSGDLTLDVVAGLPSGATATITPNIIPAGGAAQLFIQLENVTESGDFSVILRALPSGAAAILLPIALRLDYTDFASLSLQNPVNGKDGTSETPVLQWSPVPNADYYDLQVATSPSFNPSEIVFSRNKIATTSQQITSILPKGGVFYWRVKAVNEPCLGGWSDAFVFATQRDQCSVFQANDLPKNITAGVPVTIESKITVPVSASLSDINVKQVQGYHEFFAHLDVRVISPTGTEVLLFSAACGTYNGLFNLGFDDAAVAAFSCPPPNNGNRFRPQSALSKFNGQNPQGEWTLRVKDNLSGSGGQLQKFELEVCSSASLNPPILVNNNTLFIPPGTNAPVGADLLLVQDANNGPDELTFTLMSLPAFGRLEKIGAAMVLGSRFTQTDLNTGNIRFFDYGNSPGTDEFRFSVTDNEGGLITGVFVIQPEMVSTSTVSSIPGFLIAPNPSTGMVQVIFQTPLAHPSHIKVFGMDGRPTWNQSVSEGTSSIWMDLSAAASGLYLVMLETGVGTAVQKLIIRQP
jgi:subtilisin-like proprotein convertase family protein